MTDLGSKNPLQLAHFGYQDAKIFGTKVLGGSLDFNVNGALKFQFSLLNLSSKFPAGVRVRMSKYPYMDICGYTGSVKYLCMTE